MINPQIPVKQPPPISPSNKLNNICQLYKWNKAIINVNECPANKNLYSAKVTLTTPFGLFVKNADAPRKKEAINFASQKLLDALKPYLDTIGPSLIPHRPTPIVTKSPKSLLNEWCQKHKITKPKYSVEELTVDGKIQYKGICVCEGKTVSVTNINKKKCEHLAALEFLKRHGDISASKVKHDLT